MYLYFSVFVYLSQIQKYTIRSHIRSTWFHIFGLQGFTYLVYYASDIWSTRVHRQNLLKSPSHTHIYKATLHFAASLPLLVCVNLFCRIIIASFSFATVLLSMKERFFFLGPTSFGEILCWMLWLGKDFPKL